MVTSTFSYFPGVPIFHSKDLVNWKQIGHVLDRPSQLPLDGLEQSQGIFAPTIRYNDGTFYMITTNIGHGGNFVVTAKNPAGPWSEPYYLDAPGIDPSLFFDEDGRCYYTGTRGVPEGEKFFGDNEIYMRELDLNTMKLVGDYHGLWRGAVKDSVWAEGPHLYKIDGMYYVMISEGGTGPHHAVTIARSKCITGPYLGNPGNPILTHRHLGLKYPVVNVGHCDLVQTQNGDWWAVGLASRIYGGYYRNLGRETYLFPVIWEEGWPVMCEGTGRVESSYPVPALPEFVVEKIPDCDDFNKDTLDYLWNYIRVPRNEVYSLTDRKGCLRLALSPDSIYELKQPSFVGRRQQHLNFMAKTEMDFKPLVENEEAGMILQQNHLYNFSFTSTLKNGEIVVKLVKCENGEKTLLAENVVHHEKLILKVEAIGQDYSFYYAGIDGNFIELIKNVDGRILSSDMAGGFVGTEIGMYASSNGVESSNIAYFDSFTYKELK